MSKKLQKWFMHVDMDAFYASIEQKDHPELRGKPVIVGGGGPRGVVSAASYEIRKFGVHSAMPIAQALQLCPHAILVPVRMARYAEVSRTVIDVLRSYSPRVEKASVDEAYLDAMGLERLFGPVEDMARRIKREVKEVTGGLTCSIGLAPVKFLAKIASDYRKPDGLCTIHPEQALEFIARLPIESFWGVGPVTAKRMHLLGIRNGLQLRKCSLETLTAHFGKVGSLYYECARGIDERPVEAVRIRKSIGCERTLERDISSRSSVIIELYHMAVELIERLQRKEFKGNTLTLKIKFHDFSQITRSITQSQELTTLDRVLPLAKELLKTVEYEQHPIRLIGLSVSNPKEEADEQHGVWEQLSFEFSDWE